MRNVVFLTVLLVLVLGSASFPGHAVQAGETTGAYFDDAAITTHAKAIIANDMDTHLLKIDVTTTNGEVVLTGYVKSSATEERLIGEIKKISGVKSVKSLLKVENK